MRALALAALYPLRFIAWTLDETPPEARASALHLPGQRMRRALADDLVPPA